MVTGFNTDVRSPNEVYHVQTEDLGVKNPVIVSQIWLRGQILETIQTRYDEIVSDGAQAIRKRLTAQHRSVIRSLLQGKYEQALGPPPGRAERPALIISELSSIGVGVKASFLILVRTERTHQPVARAAVEVLLVSGSAEPSKIYRGSTDPRGFLLAEFGIPPVTASDARVLIRATSASGSAEVSLPILIPGRHGAGPIAVAPPTEQPNLVISELGSPRAGDKVSFLILLRTKQSHRPIAQAALRMSVVAGSEEPGKIYEAATDSKGFHLAEFRIPPSTAGDLSMLIQATCPMGVAEVVIPILPT
jgi:hypothetical protein